MYSVARFSYSAMIHSYLPVVAAVQRSTVAGRSSAVADTDSYNIIHNETTANGII